MANHPSAKKRARQSLVRAQRNQAVRSRVKSATREFREAMAAGDKTVAKEKLAVATRVLRKSASKGVLPKETASRRVSRLVREFQRTGTAAQ